MTTALCFHCGDTKFGALCPCGKCGAPPTDNHDLDILFSDHRMPVKTLQEFGDVIKRLSDICDDEPIRFWAFIQYVSNLPADLMSANTPAEIEDEVRSLLLSADLPDIEVELIPIPKYDGPPEQTVEIPDRLFDAYANATNFNIIRRVEIRDRYGNCLRGFLFKSDYTPTFVGPAEPELKSEEIVAIRNAPGCLLGWLIKPKWIEIADY